MSGPFRSFFMTRLHLVFHIIHALSSVAIVRNLEAPFCLIFYQDIDMLDDKTELRHMQPRSMYYSTRLNIMNCERE